MDGSVIISKLCRKQKGRCAVCGEIFELTDKLEVDHVKPLSEKGPKGHTLSNMRLLHFECHRIGIHGKGSKPR